MPQPLIIKNGLVLLPEGFKNCSLLLKDGKIAEISEGFTLDREAAVLDAAGLIVSPGFIDLHVHGALGADFSEADADVKRALQFHHAHGTTGLLATVMTLEPVKLKKSIAALAFFAQREKSILGIHLEGPYISRKMAGAQAACAARLPDLAEMRGLLQLAGGTIRLVTLAPELPGALKLADLLNSEGIRAAMGHSNASYEAATAAVKRGIKYCTHCFNALRGFHHREPGAAGAALLEDDVYLELICDGRHLAPETVRLAARVKPEGKIVLSTDAVAAAGCKEGTYLLGGRQVQYKEGTVRTASGKLAGSTLTMDLAVGNMLEFSGLSLEKVLRMASINPACAVGLQKTKGSIEAGKDADIVLLNSRDLTVTATIIDGKFVFKKDKQW